MKRWILFILGVFLLFPAGSLLAQKKKSKSGDNEEKKENKFDELTKDATYHEGFISSYQKDGHLYLAVTPDMLDKDFLVKYEISEGIGAAGLWGGSMLSYFEGKVMAIQKHEGKLFLVQKPHRYTAEANSAEARALDMAYGNSILETGKIEATSEDSVMLVDAYDWFVSDLSNISLRVKFAVSSTSGRPGRASFDKSRSYLKSVKAFPENTNIDAQLTFSNSELSAPRTVPDGRFIPVSIHYTLAKLPEEPMKPRMADDRVGYFMTVHKDFTDEEATFFRRYVNKWRLECDGQPDENGLCEPKDPIVYYIDHTVPTEYRQAMMDGVEGFDESFREAGFKNAIKAEMLPEDADPEDIRYPTLRWSVSDQRGYGAIGPSIVDPRTGEILDADILFEAGMVQGWKNFWRSNVDPVTAFNEMFEISDGEMARLQAGGELSTFADEISAQGSLLRAALITRGELSPTEPVPDEYVYQAMKRVTMHEVGHTLGLRHNFRSSADTPFERLHDKNYTERNGLASSVMEYPAVNIAPEGEENGYYYSPTAGTYDRWVISYGYTPDDSRAEQIARQGAKDGHAYGTDEDRFGPGAFDPEVNAYDLSDDPMQWGMQRAQMIQKIWRDLPDHILTDNTAYYHLTDAFATLLNQYGRAVSTGIKYISGEYQYRDHVGDPNERGPFVPVDFNQQKEALDFMVDYVFSEDAMIIDPEVYQKFGADRWSHWGNSNTYAGRIGYPLHYIVSNLQSAVLTQLTNPYRLSHIRDIELKYGNENVVGMPELLGSLTDAVWSEVNSAPGSNISAIRRELQRSHLDRMIQLITEPSNTTPSDAISVARYELKELQKRISARLAPPAYDFDGYTRAHLEESNTRIQKALDAGIMIEK